MLKTQLESLWILGEIWCGSKKWSSWTLRGDIIECIVHATFNHHHKKLHINRIYISSIDGFFSLRSPRHWTKERKRRKKNSTLTYQTARISFANPVGLVVFMDVYYFNCFDPNAMQVCGVCRVCILHFIRDMCAVRRCTHEIRTYVSCEPTRYSIFINKRRKKEHLIKIRVGSEQGCVALTEWLTWWLFRAQS